MKYKFKNLKRFIDILLNYKALLILATSLMLIYSLISAISPRILMELIDTLSATKDLNQVKVLIYIIIILYILEILSTLFSDYIFSLIGKKVSTKIKLDIINCLFELDGKYISRLNVGDHINILDSDTRIIEQIGTQSMFSLIRDIISSIFIIGILISLQVDMVLFILIIQIVITFIQVKFSKKMVLRRKQLRNYVGEITNLEQEVLGSFMNIIQLNVKKFVVEKINNVQNKYVKNVLRFEWLCGLNYASMSLLDLIILAYILIFGIQKVSSGTLTVGGLITFLNYSQKISVPIQSIIRSNLQIQQARVSLNKIFSILDKQTIEDSNEKLETKIEGEIYLDNVCFDYGEGKKSINYDNIKLHPKSINVILGRSGVGKSTIVNLLYRLWEVNSGEILIDNININKYNLDNLRQQIGIVNQNTFLFNDTIVNNLLLGDKNKSMIFVYDICKKVKIHDDIIMLNDGYNTMLGDKGIRLSGGQLQRLAIARALIHKSKILIMDEPTSSLDEDLEKEIWFNLQPILRESTTVIFTHRKEILKYADYIYNLNNYYSDNKDELVIKSNK